MTTAQIVELVLAGMMAVFPAIILLSRARSRKEEDKSPRGLGTRVIQLISLLILIPAVVILTLEGALSSEATGTLLGVVAGYTLSGIDKSIDRDDRSTETHRLERSSPRQGQ